MLGLLCCVLLAMDRGLSLCYGFKVLEGLRGRSLFFPALQLTPADIVRVTWRSWATHIAEAKPREEIFTLDYVPEFRGRLLIHPSNLSLEIRRLSLADYGMYEVIVDTSSNPTSPKTFTYLLLVHDVPPEMVTATSEMGGPSRSTVGPQGVTESRAGDTTTQGAGGGQPPGGGRGPVMCGVGDNYCLTKGYVVVAVFGPLLMLVAAIHIMTRDRATKPGDEIPAGLRGGSEPPTSPLPQGPSPWR